ncbi:MAG: serine/threonine protein kinase [Candidatus Competibacterales bacterium]
MLGKVKIVNNHDDNSVYRTLNPDRMLDAVESVGLRCDGRLLALNSYENRVYQVGVEDGGFVIAKFYRAERWSDAAILEEHAFAFELVNNEVPVVAPMPFDGKTLHHFEGFRLALFPRRGGRWPELDDPEVRERIGRAIGRLHAVGSVHPFDHRPRLAVAPGRAARDFLLAQGWIPAFMVDEYTRLTEGLLAKVDACFAKAAPATLRLHGDCHPGNILWTEAGGHFVDLDDCCLGPAIQDLWMLLSGDRAQMTRQLVDILEGYCTFFDFSKAELHLIEALRTLRMLNYSAWLAKRWSDPAFKLNFPWFGELRYWEEQLLALRDQDRLLDEPPLVL